jgi:YHS domain-containing protein
MSTLQELGQRIEERLAIARQQQRPVPATPRQPTAEVQHAHRRFGEIADRLLHDIICPRVEKLVSYFDNAQLLKPDEADRRYTCLCTFRETPHFPATARLELTLTHDESVEHLLVLYRLEVGPVYVPFQGQVQLVFPIDQVDEEELARWVEDQIVDFVTAYLCFEYPGLTQHLVVDPVCGMVLNRNYVAAHTDYRGTTYHFCADTCRNKFVADPEGCLSVP